ncbi:alpha/beta fold hydrolase [Ottowia caeni]|uniref:alpha/beta fold hydrolase n=1 Tax=Ottowia caeni TaxID=2870339 RepID=UPI001E55D478|nr:alpha/beta hydrolase [Ottowia caeni]
MQQNLNQLALRETASILVDGVSVTYHSAGRDDGQHPVLVMVHGSTGSTDSHYGFLFPMLGFRQRVVSVDLAPPPTGALTLAQLVAQVSAVIDVVREQTGGQPVSLMGYSLGAVVAASLAAQQPEAVRQLILVAGWMKTDAHQRLRNGIWRELRQAGLATIRNYMLYCAFSPDFIAARTPQELEGMADKIGLDRFVDLQMALNTEIDITAQVPQIQARTLIVGCTHDQMVPKSHSQQLFGAIDDARYTQIDSGHGVVFERPAELLRHIDAFLQQPDAYPAGSVIPTAKP